MTHFINAFCYCVRGGRPNNEDNFYLNGKFLEQDNEGLNSVISANRVGRKNFASVVFDGMGGESCGEVASYTAAKMMGDNYSLKLVGNVERDIEVISKLTFELNDAVYKKAIELGVSRMGSTMAGVFITKSTAYVTNLGDSRIYYGNSSGIKQVSMDHVDSRPSKNGRKPALTQHLGINPEEMIIEPYIKDISVCSGDFFIICSDGVSDVTDESVLKDLCLTHFNDDKSVEKIVEYARAHGSRDNITAIVIYVNEKKQGWYKNIVSRIGNK